MKKDFVKHCLVGATAGVAADHLIAFLVSYALGLGYFMPCLASLPEQVGGEMNAVLLQLVLCAFLGAGVGAAWCILRQRHWRAGKKLLCAAVALLGFLMPAAALAACMLK